MVGITNCVDYIEIENSVDFSFRIGKVGIKDYTDLRKSNVLLGHEILYIEYDNMKNGEFTNIFRKYGFFRIIGMEESVDADDHSTSAKQKSRYSVKVQYEYIKNLPDEDLVYLVEDDYLHYPDSIFKMIESWEYFSQLFPRNIIGLFPQDFNQMYYHPQNMFNSTYVDKCVVLPGPDRYYRTTWFTHESFMVPVSLIKKYSEEFDKLDKIGTEQGAWEGNTISNVWQKSEVIMLMPLGTLAIHLGCQKDISFFVKDWQELFNMYKEQKE
jgi:hypothetical protein